MKCKDYEQYNVLCQGCDIKSKICCSKKFDFDKPLGFIRVERNDHMNVSWNECPTCGNSIGYKPIDKEYRCSKCGQRIIWD